MKELLWKLVTLFSYWSFVSRTHTFLSKTSSMNRLRVQPWVPQLAPLWPISTWRLGTKSSKYCPQPPRFWHRYVDDTFVIHKEVNKQGFLQHINSVDPAIKFTVKDNKEDGSIPFLDTIGKPEADGQHPLP